MRPDLRSMPGLARSEVVFGDPYETPDGATVIMVSRVYRRASGPRWSAVGIYTIRDGRAVFSPAMDGNRLATFGIATGFVAAVIGTLAVLRQPPWPKLTGTITVNRRR